jgi:hypothetical protein
LNQKKNEAAVSELNGWLKQGYFDDPYTKDRIPLNQGSGNLTWSPTFFGV